VVYFDYHVTLGQFSIRLGNIYIAFFYYLCMVILFDLYNMPEDIYKVIFATEQQEIVGKLLLKHMMANEGEIGKTEMSLFATNLHEGKVVLSEARGPMSKEQRVSYNRRQFYDRILTPMKSLGLIDYDMYKKTYRVSDRFNKVMIKVGLMWLREHDKMKKENQQ